MDVICAYTDPYPILSKFKSKSPMQNLLGLIKTCICGFHHPIAHRLSIMVFSSFINAQAGLFPPDHSTAPGSSTIQHLQDPPFLLLPHIP